MGRIERFTSRVDAELARSSLEAADIPAYVSGDDMGGLHPEIPYGIGGTVVVVPDERHSEARAVLDASVGREPETDTADGNASATRGWSSRNVVFKAVAALMLALVLIQALHVLFV